VRVAAVAVAIALAACGGGGAKKTEPIGNETPSSSTKLDPVKGHELVDTYFENMRSFSVYGGVEPMLPALEVQLSAGRVAHEAGEIADDVFERHQTLVTMTAKLFEAAADETERKATAEEVRAWAVRVEGAGEIGDGAILIVFVPAILAEVVNLHMMIDGVPAADREAQRAAYTKKYVDREEPGVKTYDFPAN